MNAAQKLIREHNLTWEEFAELIKMADDPQVDALLAEEAVRDAGRRQGLLRPRRPAHFKADRRGI